MSELMSISRDDVSLELATRAHNGTSFSPDKRGNAAVDSYITSMRAVAEEFERHATDDNREQIAADLADYKRRYIDKMTAYWSAHSRVVSTMIAGPSGFPARTMEKRNATADKRREEWLSWNTQALDRLRNRYDPRRIARAPISADDDDAIGRLEAKLAALIEHQGFMKSANRICRKKIADAEKVAQLVEFGIGEPIAYKIIEPDSFGDTGFPSYELRNNNANIRRIRARIDRLRAERERPEVDDREVGGVTVIENRDENRLQLVFPDEPDAATRKTLKANGFRWAPSQMAWQRQLTDNARHAAKRVLEGVQ